MVIPYLVGLLWAVLSALVLRWSPAAFVVIFLAATLTVMHAGWLLFGILTAMGGAVAGVALMNPRRRAVWWRRLVASPVSIGLALLLAGVWIAFLVNRGGWSADEFRTALKESKTITLGAVLYVAGFYFSTSFSRARLAIWALLGTSGALAGLRILQMGGLDVTAFLNQRFGMAIFSDLRPLAMQNGYAAFLAMTLMLGLFVVLRYWRQPRKFLVCAAGFVVFQWLLVDTSSRTAMIAYGVGLLTVCVLIGQVRHKWITLAIVGALFGVQAVLIPWADVPRHLLPAVAHVAPKQLFPATPQVDSRIVTEETPVPTAAASAGITFWTSTLASPRFAIVQRIRISPSALGEDNALNLFMRRAAGGEGTLSLDVYLDAHLVHNMTRPLAHLNPFGFSWVRIPVPRDLLEGKSWVTVRLQLRDEGDQQANYVSVMGGNFFVEGIQSEFFNGFEHLTEDLSELHGRQIGTFLIFLNAYWPTAPLRVVPLPSRSVDNSIIERIAWARLAIANYLAYPMGSGFGSLSWLATKYHGIGPVFIRVRFANLHNNFLQILSECGPLGELGWLVMVFAPIVLIVRRLRGGVGTPQRRWFNASFCAFFLVWALTSVAQYTVTDTRLFHLWLFFIGVWAAQIHRGDFGLVRVGRRPRGPRAVG